MICPGLGSTEAHRTCRRFGAVRAHVSFQELRLVVAIRAHASDETEQADETPRGVELPPEKPGARAARKRVVVVVPFARHGAGEQLIDRQVLTIEIDAGAPLVFAASMRVVVEV